MAPSQVMGGSKVAPPQGLTGSMRTHLEPLGDNLHKRRFYGPLPCQSERDSHQRAFSEPEIVFRTITAGPVSGAHLDEKQSLEPVSSALESQDGASGSLDSADDKKTEAEDTIVTSTAALDTLARLHQLPSPKVVSTTQYLWNSLSMYMRLFAFVLVANVIAAVAISCITGIDQASAGTASATNFVAAIAFRNEHVVNFLFRVACLLRPSSPLFLRRVAAKVYSYGGFHSGCASAGTVWYLTSTFLLVLGYQGPSEAVLSGLAILNSTLVCLIICFAIPSFRVAHHNSFELIHRFGGWAAIAVFWAVLVLSTLDQSDNNGAAFALNLLRTTNFWYFCIITLAIIYPWSRLRWRSVRVEVLSPKAALLHFDYRTMEPCLGVRLTDSPLKETHSFATIAAPGDANGFRVLMSRAGDWTSNFIDHPPSHIWVKGAPTLGVMRVALLFKKVLVVATGTGIGPCLSLLESCPDCPVHVLWMASGPRASFGDSIINAVYNADPGAWIVDTTKAGRGNILALAHSGFVESGAEAVVIISNATVTAVVVEGLEGRGIPVYGAIFDS